MRQDHPDERKRKSCGYCEYGQSNEALPRGTAWRNPAQDASKDAGNQADNKREHVGIHKR